MAFTTRSRKDGLPLNRHSTPDDLGPGYYSLSDSIGPTQKAFAPFTSLTDKFVDPTAVRSDAPPPGTYDTSPGWGAPGPGSTISGLPCKFVPFKSSADRFGAGSVFGGSAKEQPGPGEYKLKGVSDLPPAQAGGTWGRQDSMPPDLRAMSAPSIPVGHQSWGYSDGPRGLIRHSGPQNYTGVGADRIGPNVYDPSLTSVKSTHGGRSFGKAAQREPVKGNGMPGPGQYKTKGLAGGASARRSASFMSTSKRSGAKSSDGPDPGAYNPLNGAIRIKPVRADQQFFHSTAERFPTGGRRHEEATRAPGPGQYVIKPPDVAVTNFARSGTRFGGYGDFTEPWRSCVEAPGPGAYETEPAVDEEMGGETAGGALPIHSFSVLAHQGTSAFGSTVKRFAKKIQDEMPGPASYAEQNRGNRAADDSYAKKVRESLPDTFTSKSVKLKIAGGFHDQKPEPATYNPKLPAANIPRNKQPSEGFNSSAPRGWERKPDEKPGPGAYPVTYGGIGYKPTVNRSLGTGTGLGFAVSEKREDAGIRHAAKEDLPGPGSYDVSIDLNSKTHNQLFTPGATQEMARTLQLNRTG